jgi:hypothetical protein
LATPKYCNTTTDLTDVYNQIEEYSGTRYKITGWEVYSTAGYIYKSPNTGEVGLLYQDNIRLSVASAIASINSASKWYYDSTNDILYMRSSDNADPDTHEVEKGINWYTFKTRMRDQAQDQIDAMLDRKFPRPIPQARQYHTTNYYDISLVRATALLTCFNILKAYGEAEKAKEMLEEVTNNDKTGIIDNYNSGALKFSWETTVDELGGYNIEVDSSNTGTGFIEFYGKFGGSIDLDDPLIDYDLKDEIWLIQIDKAGAVGTATFKWSRDNGVNWDAANQLTSSSWVYLSAGIFIRFWDRSGSFIISDKWRGYMFVERREDVVEKPIILMRG